MSTIFETTDKDGDVLIVDESLSYPSLVLVKTEDHDESAPAMAAAWADARELRDALSAHLGEPVVATAKQLTAAREQGYEDGHRAAQEADGVVDRGAVEAIRREGYLQGYREGSESAHRARDAVQRYRSCAVEDAEAEGYQKGHQAGYEAAERRIQAASTLADQERQAVYARGVADAYRIVRIISEQEAGA